MPDGFQPELPRWSSGLPSTYERYSEVSLRKPDGPSFAGRWVIIAVAAAFVSVGLIAVLALGLAFQSSSSATFVYVSAATAPAPAPVVLPGNGDGNPLHGTWAATALVVNGEPATDDELTMVQLTLDVDGFRMVLPTIQKNGELVTDVDRPRELDFVVNGKAEWQGIYQINGDALKICLTDGQERRPADFISEKDSQRILLVLKRAQP